jgi:hypothetical protein
MVTASVTQMDLTLAKFADFVGQFPTARRTSERQYRHGGPFHGRRSIRGILGATQQISTIMVTDFPEAIQNKHTQTSR